MWWETQSKLCDEKFISKLCDEWRQIQSKQQQRICDDFTLITPLIHKNHIRGNFALKEKKILVKLSRINFKHEQNSRKIDLLWLIHCKRIKIEFSWILDREIDRLDKKYYIRYL